MRNKYNGYEITKRRGTVYVNGVSLFHILNRPGLCVPKGQKIAGKYESAYDYYFNEIYPKEQEQKKKWWKFW